MEGIPDGSVGNGVGAPEAGVAAAKAGVAVGREGGVGGGVGAAVEGDAGVGVGTGNVCASGLACGPAQTTWVIVKPRRSIPRGPASAIRIFPEWLPLHEAGPFLDAKTVFPPRFWRKEELR